MADKEPESWITVNGKHIPISAGESKDEAIKKALAKDVDRKDSQIKANEAETKRVQEQHSEKGKADERTQQEHTNVVKELSKDNISHNVRCRGKCNNRKLWHTTRQIIYKEIMERIKTVKE